MLFSTAFVSLHASEIIGNGLTMSLALCPNLRNPPLFLNLRLMQKTTATRRSAEVTTAQTGATILSSGLLDEPELLTGLLVGLEKIVVTEGSILCFRRSRCIPKPNHCSLRKPNLSVQLW